MLAILVEDPNMGQIRARKYANIRTIIHIFNFMLRWVMCIDRFWVKFVQQWYTKLETFIPHLLGHMENIFWTLVNALFMFLTFSSFAMLSTTRFFLSSTRLILGRAPALQPRQMVLCQAPAP